MSLKNFRQLSRKIVCVGRNYKDHALELSNPIPSEPLLFSKTTNCYLAENEGKICRPPGCKSLHYEAELGVVISKKAHKISKINAMDYIGGYTIALDMTARDLQDVLKKSGSPWFIAKSFDTSCPVGDFVDASMVPDPQNVEIYCKLNGVIRQKSLTNVMIFDIPTLVEYISHFVTLERGDLILTGTPAGVGACQPGDVLEIGITGLLKSSFTVE